MKNVTRLILDATALAGPSGRTTIQLICQQAAPAHIRTRKQLKRRFKNALVRVLKFAKHETLRKLHRYAHANKPLSGAAEDPGAFRITFNVDELQNDLDTMLQDELPDMLNDASQSTLQSVGYTDPWSMPSQDVLDFVSRRQNLLSGVSDELFSTVRSQISDGLQSGEGLSDLSKRIANTFDDISTGRAEVIADTEAAAAYSFASNQASQQAGVQYKKWLHGSTSKVPRPDHLAIDGLVVPFDEAFPVGDPPLMYPHDENGSAEDVINCSCIAIPVGADEYAG